MMGKCTDVEVGALLHAYELGALSEDDTDRFEIHMMQCEHCYNEVSEFGGYSDALRYGEAARRTVAEAAGAGDGPKSSRSFLTRLWPSGPFYLRPGLIYLVVLMLLIPAVSGIRQWLSPTEAVRPLQSIHLAPTRVMQRNIFEKSGGTDGIITFVIPEANSYPRIHVAIFDPSGSPVVEIDNFEQVDEYDIGRVFVPLGQMKTGVFRLVISKSSGESPGLIQEYRFKINP